MDLHPELTLMLMGILLLIGENWIINQVKKIHKASVSTVKILILFSSVGATIAGIPSVLIHDHINAYVFFPLYGLLLLYFVKRSYSEFKKLQTKPAKTWFIVHFVEGSYFLGAVGIYMFFMAPFANMMM